MANEHKDKDEKKCFIHDITVEMIQLEFKSQVAEVKNVLLEELKECFVDFKKEFRKDVIDNLNKTLYDHEIRIRTIENKIMKWAGIFLLAAVLLQIIGGAITAAVATSFVKLLLGNNLNITP